MTSNGREDHRPEADEDEADGATPAEFIDRPENLPGEQDHADEASEQRPGKKPEG